MDCNPPGSSVHGILQARILDWVVKPSSGGSSQPRDPTHISCLLHWQVDSLPLCHLGSPSVAYITSYGKRDDITDSVDVSLSKLQEMVKDRAAWCAGSPWGSQSVGHD